MDVTNEILKNDQIYSASDNTNPDRYASSKVLNYAKGASINKPDTSEISVVPFTLEYEDAIGLFGTENFFVKVRLVVDGDIVLVEYMEPGYTAASIDFNDATTSSGYTTATVNPTASEGDSGWESAATPALTLPDIGTDTFLSVKLTKHATGNIYNDAHVDVRLYTSEREEHPYDIMFIKPTDHFYIGVHARNTRRIPYSLSCEIGKEYLAFDAINNLSYVMKTPDRPTF
tara:strand:+ start:356 stop:1045 length:690 start_codon:yes stop_codon:yes gene_type:complete